MGLISLNLNSHPGVTPHAHHTSPNIILAAAKALCQSQTPMRRIARPTLGPRLAWGARCGGLAHAIV